MNLFLILFLIGILGFVLNRKNKILMPQSLVHLFNSVKIISKHHKTLQSHFYIGPGIIVIVGFCESVINSLYKTLDYNKLDIIFNYIISGCSEIPLIKISILIGGVGILLMSSTTTADQDSRSENKMSFGYLLNKAEPEPERPTVNLVANRNNPPNPQSRNVRITLIDTNDSGGTWLQRLFANTSQAYHPIYTATIIMGPGGNHVGISCTVTENFIEDDKVSVQSIGVLTKAAQNNILLTSGGLPLEFRADRNRAKVVLVP